MGSSKKHKDKEKDRDRESRKRHHRSRSRSRSRSKERHSHRDRKEKQRERSRSRSKERERKRAKDYSYSDENQHRNQSEKVKIKEEKPDSDTEPKVSNSGNEVSLSIAETNKLRIKLGLKPLDVSNETSNTSVSTKDSKDNEEEKAKKDFVHKPAENLADKAYVEKLREKIALQKEKRKIQEKLKKVKGLGDSESDDETTADWIQKIRLLQEEKDKAEKRAKLLEEMDEEFGIGNLVEDEFKLEKQKIYSSKHLKGLTVEHSEDKFKEGKQVILTIKDKGVLDEEDDVLINVNLLDEEKAEKNSDIKKKKIGYDAYDDPELDEFGNIKKTILNKYDEEIDGEKKKSFVIGPEGQVDIQRVKEIQEIRKRIHQKQADSLELPALTLASEYLTEPEMVKFKKPKKKVRKIRKQKSLRADDLSAYVVEHDSTKDFGSRKRDVKIKQEPSDEYDQVRDEFIDEIDIMDVDSQEKDDFDKPERYDVSVELSSVPIEPDEAELELQIALNRARKLKQKEESLSGGQAIAEKLKSRYGVLSDDGTEQGNAKGSIVMNSTAEFCRALGDIPTYGLSGNRDEDVEDLMDFDRDFIEDRKKQDDDGKQYVGAWNEVGIDEKPVEIKKEDAPILEEEPDVSVGLAGALKLAMKKGYLEKEMKKVVSAPRHSQLEAANYTIEDKSFFDDDKYGRRDRYCAGPVTDFREKDTYRPDVKLEYIDDNGRLLTPKEAFRYLSHKFHGKGSGKNKTEKRMKKLQEEALMKQMSSTDTPLGTLALLQEKQKQTQSPFILLSGGSKALNPNAISKPT